MSQPADPSSVPKQEEKEEKAATENCQYVKDFVDKKILEELIDMGFPLLRAEKSLLFTNNTGLEPAIAWLDENQEDSLVDDPVTEVTTGETEKKKLTKEEAEARAMELQKRLSHRRKELDKKEAQEKERERIKSTKAMLETNRILEDGARKKAIADAKREREIDLSEKKRLEELMKRDWEERFGRPYDPELAKPKENKLAKSSKDQIILHLNAMKKEYETTNRVGLKKCLSTLRIYATNAKDNPTEKKYHRIK
eukprot:GHVP01036311.1.p1 GENE.GHVP01036311.1~~GHVP01036311.1.p1  ORF type:complete len:253 (+),score=78.86 GHVP01036311.1:103-861(+)